LTSVDRIFIFVSIGITIAAVAFVAGLENTQTTDTVKKPDPLTQQQEDETTVFQQGLTPSQLQPLAKQKLQMDISKGPPLKVQMSICNQVNDLIAQRESLQEEYQRLKLKLEEIVEKERFTDDDLKRSDSIKIKLEKIDAVLKISEDISRIARSLPNNVCNMSIDGFLHEPSPSTSFQNFDQKWNQLFNMLNTVMKNKRDIDSPTQNMR